MYMCVCYRPYSAWGVRAGVKHNQQGWSLLGPDSLCLSIAQTKGLVRRRPRCPGSSSCKKLGFGWWRDKSRTAGAGGPGQSCLVFSRPPSYRAGQYLWITFWDVTKTCSEINTTQGYGTPEKDLAVLCLLLITKKLLCFYFKGWFTNYNCILQWHTTVWLFQ